MFLGSSGKSGQTNSQINNNNNNNNDDDNKNDDDDDDIDNGNGNDGNGNDNDNGITNNLCSPIHKYRSIVLYRFTQNKN